MYISRGFVPLRGRGLGTEALCLGDFLNAWYFHASDICLIWNETETWFRRETSDARTHARTDRKAHADTYSKTPQYVHRTHVNPHANTHASRVNTHVHTHLQRWRNACNFNKNYPILNEVYILITNCPTTTLHTSLCKLLI